jgi:hypothetical protein
VEISGGVPIPQTGTFPRTKACDHSGDRTQSLWICYLLLYLYTTAALVIEKNKKKLIRNTEVDKIMLL